MIWRSVQALPITFDMVLKAFWKSGAGSIEKKSLRKMESEFLGSDKVKLLEVGFMAEYMTNSGQGFYIVRDDKGKVMQ